MSAVRRVLRIGDIVYLANGGIPVEVTQMNKSGFIAGGEYYSYQEVRLLYFLTKRGYEERNAK